MKRILIPLAIFTLISRPAVFAQDASARSVQYHAQDIVPIHAKLKYTTLIELPATEKIMEAATCDKDFWVVDIVGNFCFVPPPFRPRTQTSPPCRWPPKARTRTRRRASTSTTPSGTAASPGASWPTTRRL
ncbi:MAG: hypothetical protein ACYDC6_11475 [Acidobacteriaceae bacterium]